MNYLLGIDIGTTSMKGMLIDEYGKKLCLASENYNLTTLGRFEVEINAERYWDAFKKIVNDIINISKINSKDIKAIAVDSQGETLICLDQEGKPLRKAIVWLDNRSTKEADEIRNDFTIEEIFTRTGQPEVAATWPATKILWLRKNERHVFEKTSKYLLVEDYINYKLTGKYVTDKSLVSSTLYFDIREGKWWKEILDFIGITEDQLPCIEDSGVEIGALTDKAAKETGLSKNTIVVTGALDQMAGAIGAGNINSEVVSESTGTCLAVCVNIQKPISYNEKYHIPCHYNALYNYSTYYSTTLEYGGQNGQINQNIHNNQSIHNIQNVKYAHSIQKNNFCQYSLLFWSQTAGVILEWYKDNFYKNYCYYNNENIDSSYINKNGSKNKHGSKSISENNDSCSLSGDSKYEMLSDIEIFKYMDYEAAKINPGSDGIILLPHFSGSAVPHFNPKAKGVFFGVDLKHTKAHFSRAIMEAVGFMLREHIDTAESFGINVKEIRSLGGGAKSSLWNQIKADITSKEIVTLENTETASLGAAMLAGVGAGIFKDLQDACFKCVRIKDRYYPNAVNTLIYETTYEKYKMLYDNIKHLF